MRIIVSYILLEGSLGLDNSKEESSENDSLSIKENLESEIEKQVKDIYKKSKSNCNYINGENHCSQCDHFANYRRIKMKMMNSNKNDVSHI